MKRHTGAECRVSRGTIKETTLEGGGVQVVLAECCKDSKTRREVRITRHAQSSVIVKLTLDEARAAAQMLISLLREAA